MVAKDGRLDDGLLTNLIGSVRTRPELLERLIKAFFEGRKPGETIGSGELDFQLVVRTLREYVAAAYVLADDGTLLGVRPDVYEDHLRRLKTDPAVDQAAYACREARIVAAHMFRDDTLREVADLRRLWGGIPTFDPRQQAIAANACGRAFFRGTGKAHCGHTRTTSARRTDLQEARIRLHYDHALGGTSMAVRIEWGGHTVFAASLLERQGSRAIEASLETDVPGDWDIQLSRN